jgi:hypothetical protein
MQKIVDGTAPDKFTVAHLKGIGFKSSNDQGIIPVLKDLKFLSADGTPTKRYHDYRDKSRSKLVLGEGLREAYEDIFHIKEHPSESDRQAIIGRFKSVHNASDAVAERQALTFLSLLKLADISGANKPPPKPPSPPDEERQKGSLQNCRRCHLRDYDTTLKSIFLPRRTSRSTTRFSSR